MTTSKPSEAKPNPYLPTSNLAARFFPEIPLRPDELNALTRDEHCTPTLIQGRFYMASCHGDKPCGLTVVSTWVDHPDRVAVRVNICPDHPVVVPVGDADTPHPYEVRINGSQVFEWVGGKWRIPHHGAHFRRLDTPFSWRPDVSREWLRSLSYKDYPSKTLVQRPDPDYHIVEYGGCEHCGREPHTRHVQNERLDDLAAIRELRKVAKPVLLDVMPAMIGPRFLKANLRAQMDHIEKMRKREREKAFEHFELQDDLHKRQRQSRMELLERMAASSKS